MHSGHPPFVRTRLSAMMFLQFFIWGGWMFAITGYTSGVLHFTGPQIGSLIGTTAIGAIFAPLFVGYVADRLFATERILAALHLVAGVCLVLAAQQKTYAPMYTLMMLNGLFFMPTLALANSLAFRHIPDPSKFPRVAVLGTIGWFVATLTVALGLGGTETNRFLYLSGGGGIAMALYALTLPHTPPKGATATGGDVFGLGAIKLLKNPSFLIFTLCAFLITIPACVFFVATVPMLQESGYPAPLALMTLNQIPSEIVLMFTMPSFVAWLGLKRVLAVGMLAWAIRYMCFAAGSFPLAIVGLLMHGFCYSFVFVGAYMFVDNRAPADSKASAQSLIAFLMLGVGWWLGCRISGDTMEMAQFQAPIRSMAAVELVAAESPGQEQPVNRAEAPLPRWDDPAAAKSAWRYLDIVGTLQRLRTGKEPPPAPDLGQKVDADRDGVITLTELNRLPDAGLTLGKFVYARDELIKTFQKVAALKQPGKPSPAEFRVTRAEWLAAQSHDWKRFWLWPTIAAFVVCVLFVITYRDPQKQAA